MQKDSLQRWTITEISLSAFVLAILLFFTYGIFVRAPYAGFHFNPQDGRIVGMYIKGHQLLKVDDVLVQVGTVRFQDYYQNGRQPLFEDVKAGEIVNIVINRNGTQLTVPWVMPGFNQNEFNSRIFNIWGLAYIYWLMGFATQLFMRPKGTTLRRLFLAVNYITSIWLILGSMSGWHLWESSTLLHSTTWLLMPIYLHLHWIFPKPLRTLPKWNGYLLYAAGFLLAIAELFQLLPRGFYALGFLLALVGSAIFLGIHFTKQPDQRREVSFLIMAILLVLTPLISLNISGVSSKIAPLTFLALPFIPVAYFYTIYRRQLGGLELRANRFISAYAFLILLGSGLLLLLGPTTILSMAREVSIFFTVIAALVIVFISILAFPGFQAFVDNRFFGIKLPYQNLQEVYSNRISSSTSTTSLLQLLEEEVFPSLLIRQFAFMHASNGNLNALLKKNIPDGTLPDESRINDLLARSGKYISIFSSADEWIRLILPLKAGDSFIGFWLLGRRDPDDLYPLAEIPILQSIANQTAIALSNILHAEQLRKMYQSDIERYESERMRLALELHDSILNELAVLRNNLDETNISPKFEASYEDVTHRLREIVSDLRPPMLMYGLKPAISEFADNLMERNGDKVRIKADLEASGERIPEKMELHLYRIVQEACENSLRYANPKNISIYGTLTPGKVDLNIHDDGEGFEADSNLELDDLLANRHFGLIGMIERAYLIDAKIKIHSSPSSGTRIHITWKNNLEES